MNKNSFLAVCMNPTIQKTLVFPGLVMDTVNRTNEHRLDSSGKGINVCRVLSQLGKDAVQLTQLGGIFRPLFLELCERDKLKVEWVDSFSSIRFCYTLINKSDKSVTELVEESEKVGEGTGELLLEKYKALIQKFSTVTISGTMAAGFSPDLIPEMVRIAKANGSRVILDIRGQDLLNSLPMDPDIIKPNLYEFAATFAPELVSNNDIRGDIPNIKQKIEDIWEELHRKYGCSLVLTHGADPVWYAEGEKLEEYVFNQVEPLNTTGSGDAFTAGLAAALDDGASLREAVAQGARCGALNAGLIRPGVIE